MYRISLSFLSGVMLACGLIFGVAEAQELNRDWDIVGKEMKIINEESPYAVSIFTDTGSGSGFVFKNAQGKWELLTNNHVVGGAATIWVQFYKEEIFHKVAVLGRDPSLDLALAEISFPLPLNIVSAQLGQTRNLKVGDRVYALGNPFGVRSVSVGWVNALGSAFSPLFFSSQTPIHSGNSGGAMFRFNEKGLREVIGMNTAIIKPGISSSTLAFTTHIDYIKKILPRLRAERVVEHAFVGADFEDIKKIPPPLFEKITNAPYPPREFGVMVAQVVPGSPAAQSNLQPGDLIVEMKYRNTVIPFSDAQSLWERIFFDFRPQQELVLTTKRGEHTLVRSVILGVLPPPSPRNE